MMCLRKLIMGESVRKTWRYIVHIVHGTVIRLVYKLVALYEHYSHT